MNESQTTLPPRPRRSIAVQAASCMQAPVVLFDVEGTLVDAVPGTLRCWHETLSEAGHDIPVGMLSRLSGLNGLDMLTHLLPGATRKDIDGLLDSQGRRYRDHYLPEVNAFPEVGRLFEMLRAAGKRIGIATDCGRDELDRYIELARIGGMIDAAACGDDVERGKPHPGLMQLVLKKLRVPGDDAVMIGDTPFDVLAARSVHAVSIGVLSGGFAAEDFRKVGSCAVVPDLEAIVTALASAVSHSASAAC